MKRIDRFKYLLTGFTESNLSIKEKDEFFEMVASGDYDDLMNADFDKALGAAPNDTQENLPEEISRNIYQTIINSGDSKPLPVIKKNRYPLLLVAAVFLGVIVASTLYTVFNTNGAERFKTEFVKSNTDRYINDGNTPQTILLPDGSHVTLQPKSSLSYSKRSFNNKREVYMEGEAMFNVAKNPNSPFLVFYHDVVTKVLGTSFNIHTNKRSGNVEVEVLSGRVQVFENAKIHRVEKKNYCIVTPNQKAVYEADERSFETTLVDAPRVIISDTSHAIKENVNLFSFENASLADVFKSIETGYKIDITVSNQSIYNCVFSGDLSKHDLYTKLKVICLAANLKYEVLGTSILLSGDGCN